MAASFNTGLRWDTSRFQRPRMWCERSLFGSQAIAFSASSRTSLESSIFCLPPTVSASLPTEAAR
ncbi:MAG: hypothetical protein C0395_05325 [Gemmatimonas sp.]|nr:hypothetical protein [Gemmatimonas sp.]